eukprot:748778-Pelagomonas_calceolata.AAC.4
MTWPTPYFKRRVGNSSSIPVKGNYLAEGFLAVKLKMKHMLFLNVLMNKFVLCAMSTLAI